MAITFPIVYNLLADFTIRVSKPVPGTPLAYNFAPEITAQKYYYNLVTFTIKLFVAILNHVSSLTWESLPI